MTKPKKKPKPKAKAKAPPKARPLNARQQRFAQEFAACGNGAEAYRRAGYKAKSNHVAANGAADLLAIPGIQAAITALAKPAADKRIATATRLKRFWTDVMEGTERTSGKPPRLADRLKAAELLAKVQGLFIEKRMNDGEVIVTVRRGADAAASLPPLPKDKT